MEAAALARRLDETFPGRLSSAARSPKRLYVSLSPEDLLAVFDWLRANVPGFRLATSTAIDLREGIGVFHHFTVNGTSLVVTLKVLAGKPNPRVPSLAQRIPAAAWIEREMHDIVGVVFEGHPDLRRLIKAEAFSAELPLRRDFSPQAFKESIGELPPY